ncbi:MAG: P-type conjugative transfer protein TrbJ [Rhodobacteraceae bacterium]|nr:P-type conjugative transfer protein TrbJ [Paracoccaceae bacterium]
MINRRLFGHRLAATVLIASVTIASMPARPAYALFGFGGVGGIVFDPTNYAQNVLQAARALQQIDNQITGLQNQAQMLINQARNLASLPYSSLQQLQSSIQRTQALLAQAQNIAYNVRAIDQMFQTKYANVSMSAPDAQLIADARARWQNTVGGLQDAMRVQATVVGNLDSDRTQMTALVGASQTATGALQATQAGNQLLALQSQQLSDLTALVAANGRARALQSSEEEAAAAQGREQRRRFLTPGSGYQPGNAQMFYGGN